MDSDTYVLDASVLVALVRPGELYHEDAKALLKQLITARRLYIFRLSPWLKLRQPFRVELAMKAWPCRLLPNTASTTT